jgi:hypothetical protein
LECSAFVNDFLNATESQHVDISHETYANESNILDDFIQRFGLSGVYKELIFLHHLKDKSGLGNFTLNLS